jgi:hypothetical protein
METRSNSFQFKAKYYTLTVSTITRRNQAYHSNPEGTKESSLQGLGIVCLFIGCHPTQFVSPRMGLNPLPVLPIMARSTAASFPFHFCAHGFHSSYTPCLLFYPLSNPIHFTLKMEAAGSSEKLVSYHITAGRPRLVS